jgi:hypothetical protein
MFLVSDSPDRRAHQIRYWVHEYPSVSLLIASAYFEWTICRTLLALSSRPNRQIRDDLEKVYGLDRYKDFWWTELRHLEGRLRLPEIVGDWQGVTAAYNARNRLIHGRDRYTRNMASPKVDCLLAAVNDLRKFALNHGVDINRRLPVRRRSGRCRSAEDP